MAEFFVTLSSHEIAAQIAVLLNMQNKLYRQHTANTVLNSAANYFVEIEGNRVVGCTGLLKEYPTLSKSYHTSVHPSHQRRGLATRLMAAATANCETEYMYGTIREGNTASLNLFKKLGWRFVKKHWNKDHFIITMAGRRT